LNIVEQHVHNIDIMLWAMGGPPEKAIGLGGRQTRKEKGNIWDHFGVQFDFPKGVRVASYCAHFDKISGRVSETLQGTKGKSNCCTRIDGPAAWSFSGKEINPYVQEHTDLAAAIRGTAPYVNEGRQVAESALTAVMGRMAAYGCRELTWKWVTETSKLDLAPPKYEFGPFTPHPIPMPGQGELI
jgi:predicted dehydrogenase